MRAGRLTEETSGGHTAGLAKADWEAGWPPASTFFPPSGVAEHLDNESLGPPQAVWGRTTGRLGLLTWGLAWALGKMHGALSRASPKTPGKPAFSPTACSLVLSHCRASAASPMPEASS